MKLFASVKDGCRIVFNGEFKSLLFYRTPKHTLNFLVEEINAAHEKAVAERDARIAELERVLESLVRAGNYLKETAETHVMQTYDTRGSVGRKISEWDAALADIKTVLGKGE